MTFFQYCDVDENIGYEKSVFNLSRHIHDFRL